MARTNVKANIDVTDVRVFKVKGNSSLLANVSITLNDTIVIWTKLVESNKGDMFVSFPSHSYKDGRKTVYKDDVFCLSEDFKKELTEKVIDAYTNAR